MLVCSLCCMSRESSRGSGEQCASQGVVVVEDASLIRKVGAPARAGSATAPAASGAGGAQLAKGGKKFTKQALKPIARVALDRAFSLSDLDATASARRESGFGAVTASPPGAAGSRHAQPQPPQLLQGMLAGGAAAVPPPAPEPPVTSVVRRRK